MPLEEPSRRGHGKLLCKTPVTATFTFLFTDIEGSTEKITRLGDAYVEILDDHNRIIRAALARNEGHEINTAGDGFFAAFDSPRNGVSAAIEMQRELASHSWFDDEPVRVRMGLHTGEAATGPSGLVGLDVHKAARLAAVGHGGQVLVSDATAVLVRDRLGDGVSLRNLGSHRLKDLGQPEEIFQLEATGLEDDFPPIRTLDNPLLLHNLPVQLTSFVGRSRELEELGELVRSSRLVTLTGAGGCGKTRLVLQAAAGLLDGSGQGVWFVDLAPLSHQELVAETVAGVLSVRTGSASVLETLQDALANRRLLLLLDNCEHVVDACAKLADRLLRSCPGVHILATSREPLGIDGELVYRVPSLLVDGASADSDAVQLFAERAKTHSPSFALDETSLPVVASICRHLDGIPLALELAAARLRSLTLSDIESRLSDRFRLLTGGSRTALPRHQTLLATMEWSYEALNFSERACFERLSVFAGGFDLAAAEMVCAGQDVDDFEVADAVTALVDKSLVRTEPSTGHARYSLGETARQFAAERLRRDPEGEESASLAHATVFLELAEVAAPELIGPEYEAWEERLESNRDNFRAACAYFVGHERDAEALRLAVALQRFWMRTGGAGEGLDVLETVLDRATLEVPPLLEALACDAAAAFLTTAFHSYARADVYLDRGLCLARSVDDQLVVSELLADAAMNQILQDHPAEGLRTATEAVEAARRAIEELGGGRNDSVIVEELRRPHHVLANALNWLSAAQREVGDLEGATESQVESAALVERLGDRRGLARVLVGLGEIEEKNGDLRSARAHWERGLEGADATAKLWLLQLVARVALRQGDEVGAAKSTIEALDGLRDNFDSQLPGVLLCAALCLSASGDLRHATQLHGAAHEVAGHPETPWNEQEARARAEDLAYLRRRLDENSFSTAYGSRLDATTARRLAAEQLAQVVARASQQRGRASEGPRRSGSDV